MQKVEQTFQRRGEKRHRAPQDRGSYTMGMERGNYVKHVCRTELRLREVLPRIRNKNAAKARVRNALE